MSGKGLRLCRCFWKGEWMMNRNKEACHCKNVTYGMLEDAVGAGASSYEEVQAKLRFGTGCGKCREFIEYLVKELLRQRGEEG